MFSLILPGRPPLPPPVPLNPDGTQFAFTFPTTPHFSHIVVFLLPGNSFPPNTAAGVHVQLPGQQGFKFLGALAEEKVSAIFKVTLPDGVQGECQVGISVESVESVRGQLEGLEREKLQAQQQGGGAGGGRGGTGQPSTKVLAQRIIKNAFNFLASFSGTLGPGGQEVVPLKSFEEWWKKFERRVEVDPGFLERDD